MLNGKTVGGLTVYFADAFPTFISLHAGIVHLSFKTTLDDIEWSDSGRVDCALCIHHMILYCRLAQCIYHSKQEDGIEWSDSRRVVLCRCNLPLEAGTVHLSFYTNGRD